MRYPHRIIAGVLPMLLIDSFCFAQDPATPAAVSTWPVAAKVFFLLLPVLAVFVGAFIYLRNLQRSYQQSLIDSSKLEILSQSPLGLPEGTIRAVLALMIVAVSLFFVVFQFFINKDNAAEIPQGLMTLLTAVVAFYFANRAGAQGAAESLALQTQSLRDQRDAAVKEHQQTKADGILGKVGKALQVTRAATAFLPPEQRKKYEALAENLQKGLSAAKGLLERGNPSEAAQMVSGVLDAFSRTNPAFQAVAKALPVFSKVLGANIPALGLITSLVGVAVRIGSARYDRWKLRILQAPIDVAALQIQPIDGLMAERLFRASPVLAEAFAAELKAGRSAELAQAANDFINNDTQSLWARKEYRFEGGQERFESQAVFEQTVQALRRLLSDDELKPYVEPEWLGPFNNYDALVGAVDQLHADEAARARLDELVLVTDGLMREGQPVLQIMENIEKELKKNGTPVP